MKIFHFIGGAYIFVTLAMVYITVAKALYDKNKSMSLITAVTNIFLWPFAIVSKEGRKKLFK